MSAKQFLIDHLLARSYYTARLTTSFWCTIAARNKPLLLVYQMGKVGSTTVEESLKAAHLDYSIFHIHVLTEEGISWEEKSYFGDTPKFRRRSLWPKTKHLYDSLFLSKRVQVPLNGQQRLKVVTLVRDPIARNISAFFQTLERTSPDLLKNSSDPGEQVERLNHSFRRSLDENSESYYRYPYDWFNCELKPSFEVDVFATDFPKAKGYQIYSSGRADILLLKLEDLEEKGREAISKFLGLDDFLLRRSNETGSKSYASIYQAFVNSLILPEGYVEDQIQKNRVDHFYTRSEIDNFRSKWNRN
jgi:hypothetical protein